MRIFCIGIGGIGLSAVAQLYKAQGYTVSGSDAMASDITESLTADDISVIRGHHEKNIPAKCDLVIYSEAIPESNPERIEAERRNLKCVTFAQALGMLSEKRKVIAITGAHGKTTTTGMLTSIFLQTPLDPTIMIGSKMPQLSGRNYRVGTGEYFLAEACEYRRNFLSLTPHILLINSLEPDHLDYFSSESDYIYAYQQLAEKMSEHGTIIVRDDERSKLSELNIKARVKTFSRTNLSADFGPSILNGVHLQVYGEHNRHNALAAWAVAKSIGVDESAITKGLESFTGTWRRLELKGQLNGAPVYDDYAHHPTEIRATLQAVKEAHPDKNIIAIFQPHQYNRTIKLKDQFAVSFANANKVYIPSIYKVRDSEQDVAAITVSDFTAAINVNTPAVHLSESAIVDKLKSEATPNDVIVVMGAGDITLLASELMSTHKKDFQRWHSLKRKINEQYGIPYYYEREIWFCSLGANIGHEQDGKHELFERPVIIIRKFNKHLFLGVPLSSRIKTGKYYECLQYRGIQYTVLTSQIRILSSKRLTRKIRTVTKKEINHLKNVIKNSI